MSKRPVNIGNKRTRNAVHRRHAKVVAAQLREEKRIARQKEDFKVKFAAMLRKLIDEREREATRIEAIARRQRIQARSQR